tara:strand:+ start:977 stop:1213 length:237 start_codon:yes stop_codon:yes gene_type:complete
MQYSFEEDIKTLSKHESFARFLETMHSLREEAIASLHKASTDEIQQISGMILCYDQVLQMSGWNQLQLQHTERLRGHL